MLSTDGVVEQINAPEDQGIAHAVTGLYHDSQAAGNESTAPEVEQNTLSTTPNEFHSTAMSGDSSESQQSLKNGINLSQQESGQDDFAGTEFSQLGEKILAEDMGPNHTLPVASPTDPEHPDIRLQPPTRVTTANYDNDASNVFNRFPRPRQQSGSLGQLVIPPRSRSSSTLSSQGRPPRTPPPIISDGSLPADYKFAFPYNTCVTVQSKFEGVWIADQEFPGFLWTDVNNYDRLIPDNIVGKIVEAYPALSTHLVYPRHGSCRVKGPVGFSYDTRYTIFDDWEDLSQKAITDICAFISEYPFQSFSLEIFWDYGSAQLKPLNDGKSYSSMIRDQLGKKAKKNFLGQEYIPRRDLVAFMNESVVKNVLEEDTTLKFGANARGRFVREILPSIKLFLVCLYHGYDMSVLHHLIKGHGYSDDPEHHSRLLTAPCTATDCDRNRAKKLLGLIPAFFAQYVRGNYQYYEFENADVVPIHHTGLYDDRKDMHLELKLGQGADGNVYGITIDPAHHYLSGNPDCEFAMKVFTEKVPFDREKAMLEQFTDYPDPHIVGHLMMWTQNQKFYILYEKARDNLRDFINKRERPTFERVNVNWFLGQLEGLAKAIKHVHHFGKPTLATPKPDRDAFWGRHNDIKPENILIFEKDKGQNPVFKIADFGHGKFQVPQGSISEKEKAQGTRTYWAPEAAQGRLVSRPMDMWALGCVYLELLLWLFRFYYEDDRSFATSRQSFPGYDPNNKSDYFWYKPTAMPYDLCPAVCKVLNELRNVHCTNMRAFLGVIGAIENLLVIEPGNRWTAKQLVDSMEAIVRQTKSDLSSNKNFYVNQDRANQGGTDVGQDLQSERLNPEPSPLISRTPSFSGTVAKEHLLQAASGPNLLAHAGSAAEVASVEVNPIVESDVEASCEQLQIDLGDDDNMYD